MAEVLKGGISNIKYIWHSSEKACKDCQALDGKEYDFEEDIPDKPHPNCQCWIEEKENEPCDCEEKINSILEKADEVEGEVESELEEIEVLKDSIEQDFNEFDYLESEIENLLSPCSENCTLTGMAINLPDKAELEQKFIEFVNSYESGRETYQIFSENLDQLKIAGGAFDKYYHAKANCESAELGILQTYWAVLLSILKEASDIYEKVHKQGMNLKLVLADCIQDLKADLYGLSRAPLHGSCSVKVLEAPVLFPSPNGEKYGKNKK